MSIKAKLWTLMVASGKVDIIQGEVQFRILLHYPKPKTIWYHFSIREYSQYMLTQHQPSALGCFILQNKAVTVTDMQNTPKTPFQSH